MPLTNPITLSAVVDPATCYGDCDGKINLSVAGGTGGFTYFWVPGNYTTQDINNLCSGIYTVTVTDNRGCKAVQSFVVSQPQNIVIATTTTPAGCGGQGSITVDITHGGVPPFTYSYAWSGPVSGTANNQPDPYTISNLPAGDYTITVTASNGCTKTTTATVGGSGGFTLTATSTPTTCGQSNGTVTIDVVGGGSAPYNWSSSYGGSGSSATEPFTVSNVPGGNHTFTVTDAAGCSATVSVTVGNSNGISISLTSSPATCGEDNGTITVNVTGGSPNYTYNWTRDMGGQGNGTAMSNPFDIGALMAGTYNITVTAANGCSAVGTVTVNSVSAITIVATPTSPVCGETVGSILVDVVNGSPMYTYAWNGGSFGPTNTDPYTIQNLVPGTYNITVTDGNNCMAFATVTIAAPPSITATATATNTTCGQNNGTVTATGTGGTAPYTYNWDNGSTAQTQSGLTAGTYCVTVTDANGCTATACATVGGSNAITATSSSTPSTSCVANNGTITVDVTGGSPNYSYNWINTGTGETGDNGGVPIPGEPFTITLLAAGNYCITVTDGNGCTATTCATVNGPAPITLSATTAPSTCGGSNGSVTVTVETGGGAPYQYVWTGPNGTNGNGTSQATTFTIGNLAAGEYCVTVTNANGCTGTICATVAQSDGPNLTATVTNTTCGLNNGAINLTVTGGTTPYTYLWANGATTEDLGNLAAGTYCVTVTDAAGCTSTLCVTVGASDPIAVTLTTTPATCGQTNGTIIVDVAGGTAPYAWTGIGNGGNSTFEPFNITGLAGGTYCITVIDANGCTATACATVNSTPNLVAVVTSTTPATCGNANGIIVVDLSNGTGPYTWVGSNNLSGTAATEPISFTGLTPGTYCFTITDANGCSATVCATVNDGPCCVATATATNASACGAANGSVTVSIANGSPAYNYAWTGPNNTSGSGISANSTFSITGLQVGTYCVTITDQTGCVATACATVNASGAFTVTPLHICAPTCGETDGNFILDLVGGQAPFSYTWAGPNGSTGSGTSATEPITVDGLSSGDYCVTITDATGCEAVFCATVPPPMGLIIGALPTCATVCGGSNAKITVGVFNGTMPYAYSWVADNGNSGNGTGSGNPFVIDGLTAGTYTITITSAEGCTGTVTTEIENISFLQASATTTGVVCGGTEGTMTVSLQNGTGPYNWEGSGLNGTAANATFTINGLSSGNYCLTVTDANGCTASVCANVGGSLGGVAFNDFNANCDFGDEEFGLDSVLVYLYECNNPIPVDSVWTNEQGVFLFPNLNNYPYRLEFVVIKDSCCLKPSLACEGVGTTVQFVHEANCDIKVGFLNPADYCQPNPEIAFSCFAQGKTDEVTAPVVALVPYDATHRSQLYGDVSANNELIGSVYGLAYDRSNKYLYASAFLKRHVGLGQLGLGGIYRIDYHNGSVNPNVTPLFTVPNVGDVVRPADLSASNIPSMDTDAFGKVGKVGLGDLDIMGDNTLWTVNLFNGSLVRVDNIRDTAHIRSVEIPIASAPNCNNGVFRPLGLKIDCEKVYVGGVCTGEGSNGSSNDLTASIHVFNTKDSTWMQVLAWDLHLPNYNHGDIVGSVNPNLAQCKEWETWTDEYTERNLVANTGAGEPAQIFNGNFEIIGGGPTGAEFRCRGQAMISDIEITREGMMVVAMMDRTGHQFGYRQFRPTTNQGNPISASAGGDILAAYRVNGVWTLENNGTVPGLNRTSAFGPNSNDGPGGGEFFYDNTRYHHLDAEAGGLLYVPGRNELLGAINNPNTSEYNFGGGVVYYDLLTGSATRNDLTLLDPVNNSVGIGMANTIGDLEAMCDEAPIQIGNYVWNDANEDGVQDACESPIPGVLVSLYDGVTSKLLASTITGQNGEYYFTGIGTVNEAWIATPGRDSVLAFHPYVIVFGQNANLSQFDTTEAQLAVNGIKYHLTIANVGAGWRKDWNDSDATIADDPGKKWHKHPAIYLTTGMAGCTDHTFDAGFVADSTCTIIVCAIDASTTQGQFTLTDADQIIDPIGTASITYHATYADAQTGNGILSSPYTAQNGAKVFARVQQGTTVSVHTVNLQVAPLPVAYASELGACPESFSGSTAVFDLNSASAQVSGNASGLTVTYYLSQSDANLGINPLPSAYTSAAKQIWTRVQNAAGCYDVDALQLNVHNSPGVVLTAQDNTCSGAQQGAVTAIIFNGPADYTFTWSNGTVQGPTATHSATLNSLNAGNYAVTLTDGNGCTATASAQVNDASAFSIIPIPDYHVEAGSQVGPIVLQTSTWGANFTWTGGIEVGMPNGSTTAMMPLIPVFTAQLNSATVTVNATLGACTSTTQFTVNVTDNTPPTAVCQDITVALGSDGSVVITPVQVNGGSTDSYASLADLILSISTANFNAANLGANNVTLTVTDPSGNTASCVAIVTVLAEQGFAPTASFSDVQTQKCMAPFEIRFSDHSVGSPTAWFWTFPGGTPATSTEQNPVVVFNTPGYHVVTLEVSNAYGTHQLSKECQVLYAGMPEADFAYGVDGMNVSFANFTQNATHYVWHFGDGDVSEETSPTHEYEHPGTYLVQLTADNDCSAHVFEQWVTVSSPSSGTQDQGWLEDFRLFPNPNTGTFTVAMLGQTKGNGEVQFVLFDALGQIVHREQGDFRSGHLVQVFEYGNLPAAVYTLGIQDGQQVKYVKVVVQR